MAKFPFSSHIFSSGQQPTKKHTKYKNRINHMKYLTTYWRKFRWTEMINLKYSSAHDTSILLFTRKKEISIKGSPFFLCHLYTYSLSSPKSMGRILLLLGCWAQILELGKGKIFMLEENLRINCVYKSYWVCSIWVLSGNPGSWPQREIQRNTP